MRHALVLTLVLTGLFVWGRARAKDPEPPAPKTPVLDGPLSPEDAARAFHLESGLRIELVAAEPMVVCPVAMAFDERGRLFVAENRGYPTGPGEGKPPVGRIAMLQDTDGDGRMDKRTEFAEGLTFPNGLMPWKGGLIVTCAPDVLYLKDLDGDDKADERRVLFTGFSTAGSTQLRVSHPTLSIDNWVYLTSGLMGGKVVSPDAPGREAVTLGRADFRFRPDTDQWEAADGGSQFGMTFDDFNHRFICYNRVQCQHVVISSKILKRNPRLAFSDTVQNCPADMVAEPLKGHGQAARLYPISRNVTTADSHAGTFTAACAVTVYRGINLPPAYRGGIFSCDPTGNLVHFDRLMPNGATFTARRSAEKVETVASTDNWFRPVFLAHGPDGALYIADMYRKTIEHPDYLPEEIRKRTDFESGRTMGRIWRLVSEEAFPQEMKQLRRLDLSKDTIPELVGRLHNSDGWWRDAAHRLLLERRDLSAVPHVVELLKDPTAAPETIVQALHLLDGLDAVPMELLIGIAGRGKSGVLENAIPILTRRAMKEPNGWWLSRPIVNAAEDANPRVRFQVAIALGEFSAPPPMPPFRGRGAPNFGLDLMNALAKIAEQDGHDRWTRAAIFSSIGGRELDLLSALRSLPREKGPLPAEFLSEFGRLLGASASSASWPSLVRTIMSDTPKFPAEEQAALLSGLAQSARAKLSASQADILGAMTGAPPVNAAVIAEVRALLDAMSQRAQDASAPVDERRAAIGLLAYSTFDSVGKALLSLLDLRQPEPVRTAAVAALGALRDERVAAELLAPERFSAYTPALRDEVLAALLSQSRHVPHVLSALESGRVNAIAIDASRRRQLTQSGDPEVRKRAEKIFGAVDADRVKVYEAYKNVLALTPDPVHGRAVFKTQCASCHRLDQEGFAVGPDLFGIRNQPKEAMLLHMLAPDQEIAQGFSAYNVVTKDGRVLTGLIASETPTSLTLRMALGKEVSVLRDEVEELGVAKVSLMPQGLEKLISRQEIADLLSYLKGEGGGVQEPVK